MSSMTSPSDSMKQPGKPDGFIDDPKADDFDKHGKVDYQVTHIHTRYSSYDHDEKVTPYHYDRAQRKKKKKGR